MRKGDRVLRLKDDIRYRAVADEGVVLCQDRGEVLVVNGLGVRIIELIGQGSSYESLVATLLDEYEVDSEQLKEDVSRYLDDLHSAGVLVSETAP